VVEILDVFDFEERAPVLVMELLEGETLGTKLGRDGRLSVEETAALLLPVCSAVGTAHALGIVHRDIKPENIFLARYGEETRVKVLDFGIAKLTAEHYLEGGRSALITDTGSMLGTPCYMAPEQATGETSADHRADIWSIGVILYECLSGTRPIEGENLAQVVSRLVSAGIIPLERLAPELPHDVAALVMQMLARERARRPQSLDEISKVLVHHTMVRPPNFGPPSVGPHSESLPATEPKARLVASRDADPQGATMLSSPPVGNSVVTVDDPAPRSRMRARLPALAGLLLVAAIVATIVLSRGGAGSKPDAATAAPPAPVAVTAPQGATTSEATVAKPVAETSKPAEAASVTREKAPPPRRPLTKHSVAKKTRAGSADPTSGARAENDEGTLFPGRK
jgi:serine/threonine protein kinase